MASEDLKRLIPLWLRYGIADIRGRGVYADFPNECRCIFIHIPKTAGSSVALTLFGKVSRHVPYFQYEKANRRKFDQYFKFAFVRNPWDRLVSTYFFLKKGGLNEMDRRWAEEVLKDYGDFDSFVRGWVNEQNIWNWVHFLPQHHFICDERMALKMDFVGRMEHLQRDFALVAKKLGCERQLATVNKGAHRHYPDYYTEDTRAIVGRVYGADVKAFGYSFGTD